MTGPPDQVCRTSTEAGNAAATAAPPGPGAGDRVRGRGRWRIAVVTVAVLLVVGVAILVSSGVIDLGILADPVRLRSVIEGAGAAAPILFVALALVMHLLQLSGFVTVMAVLIWPTPVAIAVVWVTALLSSLMVFALVRRFGRGWAERHVPRALMSLARRLEARPIATVTVVRTLLHINFPIDCLFALSRIRFRVLVLCTAVALVPSTLLHVVLGDAVLALVGQVSPWVWALLAVAVVIGVVVARRRRRRGRSATQPSHQALGEAAGRETCGEST